MTGGAVVVMAKCGDKMVKQKGDNFQRCGREYDERKVENPWGQANAGV